MKNLRFLLSLFLASALSARAATALESGEFFVDLRESPRVARASETLAWSTRWAGVDALAGSTRKARLSVAGYSGAETLEDVPALVRLSTAIQGFDYSDFADPATGADLVFCDESETTVYPHEIDEWNTNGESLVWVRLPALVAGTTFKMGYGGTPATAAEIATKAHAVWSDYAGVWHMNEDSGRAFDSTANGLDATPTAGTNSFSDVTQMIACEQGAVGRARVNATDVIVGGQYLQVSTYDTCQLGATFVISGWFHADRENQFYSELFMRDWRNGGWGLEFSNNTVSKVNVIGGGAGDSSRYIQGASLLHSAADGWTWICVVYGGTTASLYQDGERVITGTIVAVADNGSPLRIGGGGCDGTTNGDSFVGQYDEIRLRGGTLSADRIRADYDMIANPGFVTCGAVETIATSGVEIRLDGEVFAGPFSGEGTVSWAPAKPGTYEFEHVSLVGGEAVATESASFVVPGPADDDLSIVAECDLVEGVSVRLGGAPDGWTLHYTTNESTPTAESPAYTGPFTLDESATVKAVAVNDELGWTTDVAEQRFDLAPPLAVTGARARQRYPWNGLVDVDFTLTGDTAKCYRVSLDVTDLDGGTNLVARTVWEDGGAVTNAALDLAPDEHRLVWNAGADLPEGFVADNVAVSLRAEYLHDTALYMVVDLSGGPNAEHYPVSYLPDVPEGGWTDEYKTDKLVLRRIEPGWFTMGSPEGELGRGENEVQHSVSLTEPFYVGVFELTQRQWELVEGGNPSLFSNTENQSTKPVEEVHWGDIRGLNQGNLWPESPAVDDGSFMDILRRKSERKTFDLPTEAQWEYACRAGTTTSLNTGFNLQDATEDAHARAAAVYAESGVSDGTVPVGSLAQNAWGLYDMHGNVHEQCLDWFGLYPAEPVVNPVGAIGEARLERPLGYEHVTRGGGYTTPSRGIRSARRLGYPVDGYQNDHNGDDGFRLFLHNAPAVVEAPIVAPEGLTATTNRTGDVTLSWEPVAGAYAYQIRRSKTGAFEDGTWLNTVTNTTYADWTAEARTDYTYWVRAQFESGKVGRWSKTAEGCRCELTAQNAPYMVIDLSGGSSASSYPVSYLDAVPAGGWTDEYKTTKMVFRKVEPGTFTMGSPSSESGRGANETQHQVTITKPFFISVFEMTEKQHAQIAGGSATSKKPVRIKWTAVRGVDVSCKQTETIANYHVSEPHDYYYERKYSASSYCWPNSSNVDASSVVGKLRTKTGMTKIDLPTEAQWEFACRGGSSPSANYGGSNGFSSLTEVGLCEPSETGLYDLLGNTSEWCLDICNSNSSIPDYGSGSKTDPAGATANTFRYTVEYRNNNTKKQVTSDGSGTFTYYSWNKPFTEKDKYTYRIVRGNSSRPASRSMAKSSAASAGVRLVVPAE